MNGKGCRGFTVGNRQAAQIALTGAQLLWRKRSLETVCDSNSSEGAAENGGNFLTKTATLNYNASTAITG
jgi:hypothetical protein